MSWRLVAWWTTAIGLVAWVLMHFALVLLVLVPSGALPHSVRGAASAYVDPIFRQSWWLFAPNPPFFDRVAHVRGTYPEDGESRSTPWLPLTEPVIRAVQENRLSSQDAALTVLLHAMYSLGDAGLMQVSPVVRELLIASWGELAQQPASLIALERAGAAALTAEYPDLAFEQVQVRLTVRRLPPYAERERAPGEPEAELVFRPVPFQDVAPWSPGR